jgi:hypothetical protein
MKMNLSLLRRKPVVALLLAIIASFLARQGKSDIMLVCPYNGYFSAAGEWIQSDISCLDQPLCPFKAPTDVADLSYGTKTCLFQDCKLKAKQVGNFYVTPDNLYIIQPPSGLPVAKVTGYYHQCLKSSEFTLTNNIVYTTHVSVRVCCGFYCSEYRNSEPLKGLLPYCRYLRITFSDNPKHFDTVNYDVKACDDVNCWFCLERLLLFNCSDLFQMAMLSLGSVSGALFTTFLIVLKVKCLRRMRRGYQPTSNQELPPENIEMSRNAYIASMLLLTLLCCTVEACSDEVSLINSNNKTLIDLKAHRLDHFCLTQNASKLDIVVEGIKFIAELEFEYASYMPPFTWSQWDESKSEEKYTQWCGDGFYWKRCRQFITANRCRYVESKNMSIVYTIKSIKPQVVLTIKQDHHVMATISADEFKADSYDLEVMSFPDLHHLYDLAYVVNKEDAYIVFPTEFNRRGQLTTNKFGLIQGVNGKCLISPYQLYNRDPNLCNGHFGGVEDCNAFEDDSPKLRRLPINFDHFTLMRNATLEFEPDSSIFVNLRLSMPKVDDFERPSRDCHIESIAQSGINYARSQIELTIKGSIDSHVYFFNKTINCLLTNGVCTIYVTGSEKLTDLDWHCGNNHGKLKVSGKINEDFDFTNFMSRLHTNKFSFSLGLLDWKLDWKSFVPLSLGTYMIALLAFLLFIKVIL